MNILNNLQKLKGTRDRIKAELKKCHRQLQELEDDVIAHEQAREVVTAVGLETQRQLQYHISDITSMALEAVFGNNAYELKVDFVQRRGKAECDLSFVREGKEIEPLEASGYGAVDVAAFALRIASWSMQTPQNRAVMLMDEPMRNLDARRLELASNMQKKISEKLGIQFVIVTHEPALTEQADLTLKTEMKNKETKMKLA